MEETNLRQAVEQICEEKGIAFETVVETIEAALAAAYRKDFGDKLQNIQVDFDMDTSLSKVFDVKTVVEDLTEEELAEMERLRLEREAEEAEAKAMARGRKTFESRKVSEPKKDEKESKKEDDTEEEEEKRLFNPKTDIQLSDAKETKKSAKVDDVIRTELDVPDDYGRMAAQTAKQVIIQKLREAERDTIFEEYQDKVGELLIGTVQRREGRLVLVDMGRTAALLPPEEQIPNERYAAGDRLKFYLVSVERGSKGPEIIVSRAHAEIVRKLFTLEIPEIANGVVEIKGIAREAGSRTKVAVFTEDSSIDPIGSCIGQRGARVQTIISELRGEKVDIIEYNEDVEEFITNALSPAKVSEIKLDDEAKSAIVTVDEDQLSLAIGRAGQNVRLAAKLTGWKIDIVSDGKKQVDSDMDATEVEAVQDEASEENGDQEEESKTEEKPEEEKEEKTESKKKKPVEKEEKEEKSEDREEDEKKEKGEESEPDEGKKSTK